MNSWSSGCNTAEMANNLMRWWRTKFFNSYKPFTVEGSDTRVSDTEELLSRGNGEYHTTCTTPPLQSGSARSPAMDAEQSSTPRAANHNQLNLQEFSCDVSVEGGPGKSTQERQEFSFTLYDFDGHGKITKDDIAGLVTTIYEVLGSSVKVPHYGSKTIKVKLTVSPAQRKHTNENGTDHKNNSFEEKQSEPNHKSKQDNVASKNGCGGSNNKRKYCRNNRKETDTRKHYCCRKLDEEHDAAPEVSDDYSDVCSRVSLEESTEDEEEECSDVPGSRCKRSRRKRYQKHLNSKHSTPNYSVKESNMINARENFLRSKKVKKRSSSLQRRELLEIIQSNMEKNSSSFQTNRKPSSDHIILENNTHSQNDNAKQHKHRHRPTKLAATPLHYLADIVDPTHLYVDLASLQNTNQRTDSNCKYDKLIDAVMCVSGKKLSDSKNESSKRHYHNKSYHISDTPFRYQLLGNSVVNIESVSKTAKKLSRKTTEFEPTTAVKRNIRKFPQVVLGHTSSPHHLRHRNRQEDQARAMAQVVRWLEQEFSSSLNTNDSKEKVQPKRTEDQEKYSCSMPTNVNSNIERHEHHHVHEHIHHHYHHYQDTSLVV